MDTVMDTHEGTDATTGTTCTDLFNPLGAARQYTVGDGQKRICSLPAQQRVDRKDFTFFRIHKRSHDP